MNLRVVVPHRIGRQEALRRVRAAEEELRARFEKRFRLKITGGFPARSFIGTFKGSRFPLSANGTIFVKENEVVIEATIPALFRTQAEKLIRVYLQSILAEDAKRE